MREEDTNFYSFYLIYFNLITNQYYHLITTRNLFQEVFYQ